MCTDEILDTYHILKAGLKFSKQNNTNKTKNKPQETTKNFKPIQYFHGNFPTSYFTSISQHVFWIQSFACVGRCY